MPSRPRIALLASTVLALVAVGCSDDETPSQPPGDTGVADTLKPGDTGTTLDTGSMLDSSTPDATGTDATTPDATGTDSTVTDAKIDATSDARDGSSDGKADTADAAPDAGMAAFCADKGGWAFCDDFDSVDALMPGKTKWDFLEGATPPVLKLSSARAVSKPSSLLADFPGEPAAAGLRFAKTIASTTFTRAQWEFDVYFDALPNDVGFFLTDYQFSDDGGADRFGFRFVVFSDGAGNFKEGRIEHNRPAVGMGDVFEPFLPTGTITDKKWVHFKMESKFTFGAANEVAFKLWIDGAATPSVDKTYEAPPRDKVNLVRMAGLPFLFQKKAGHKIHWDNVTLRVE